MTTTCAHVSCETVVDVDDFTCREHTLALQLIGYGVPAEDAHRLAAIDGKPVATTATELVEDDDGPAGVETTTTTGDVFVIVPALFAHLNRKDHHR